MTTLELVKKLYGLFLEGNIPALVEYYHEDVTYHIRGGEDVPWAGTYKGKEKVLTFFQKLDQHVEITKFNIQDIITDGDRAAVMLDMSGRIKATGKTANYVQVHWITFKGGKLLGFWDFPDTYLIHKALQPSKIITGTPHVN